MKNSKNMQRKLMYATSLLVLLIGIQKLEAQSYNYFQQKAGDSSDYFITIEWGVQNNATSCTCVPNANTKHEIHYIDPNFSNDVLFTTITNANSTPWNGVTVANSKFPGYQIYYYGYVENTSVTTDFFAPGDCFVFCAYNTTHPNVLMQSQPLKNAKNLKIFHENTGSAKLTWDVVTDIPYGYELRIKKNGSVVQTIYNKNTESWTDPCPSVGDVYALRTYFFDGFNIADAQTTDNSISFTQQVYDSNIPTGSISGNVVTKSCNGETGVTIKATLMNPNEISNGDCWPAEYFATTFGSQGNFTIPNLYKGIGSEMAEYRLEALLPAMGNSPAHRFRIRTQGAGCPYNPNDSTRLVVLSTTNPTSSNESFVDITSFSITGQITSVGPGFNACGLDSVHITATPGNIFPTDSDPNGDYGIVVDESGPYVLTATYKGVVIGVSSVNVNGADAMLNFSYTETDTLHGFIGAGCFEPIGSFQIQFKTETCILKEMWTNTSGYYETILPSQPFTMQVVDYNPGSSGLDMNTVLNTINEERDIDLQSKTELNIFYRKPLKIEVSGFPGPPCPAVNYPVLEQLSYSQLVLLVWEEVGICLADTGYILVQDNISTISTQSTILDTVFVNNGVGVYNLRAGEPALDPPYLKNITFTAFVDSQMVSQTLEVIVSGSRQRTAAVLTGPPTSLPYMILRDPPGDQSYSYIEEDTTTSYVQSFSTLVSGGVRGWVRAKAGYESALLSIEAWAQIEGSLDVGGGNLTAEETIVEIGSSTMYSTGNTDAEVGPGKDVIIGGAVNYLVGISDERIFDVNTCSIVEDEKLVFSPNSWATEFAFTVDRIREKEIPFWHKIAQRQDTTQDARQAAAINASLWEQTLQYNDELKEEALKNKLGNKTIDAGTGAQSLAFSNSSSSTKTLEFNQYIDINIAAELGLEISGSGFAGGLEVKIRTEFGQSESTQGTSNISSGAFLDDDDTDNFDKLSFDYAVDPIYGTMVFSDPLGETSCPHEEGTQRIDLPTLTTPNPVKFVASGNEVEFQLKCGNASEVDEPRTYLLDFDEASNPLGALVFTGANPFSGTIPLTITPGVPITQTIRVERAMVSTQYAFEGLKFDLYPECEPDLKKSVFLSAYFANSCSNINLVSPTDNWLINSSDEDQIAVIIDGYVLDPEIDTVRLTYKLAGTEGDFKIANVILGPNLIAPPYTFNWDVANLPDGFYNIRMELVCGDIVNLSNRSIGIIDRTAPVVFGNERPSDDLLHPGDKISVDFNEDIDGSNLNGSNVFFNAIPENIPFSAQYIIDGNEVIIVPDSNLTLMYNQAFEIGLINVTDIHNNVRPDTVKWEFVVSEPDSDRDGVRDLSDRCPGGDDKIDTDMDGLPDDCDCVPTIASNGRGLTKAALDFDGVNNYIKIPHDPNLIPTASNAVTIETWVYPTESTNEHGIISQSGNWPNRNHQILFNHASKKINVTGTGVSSLFSNDTIPYNKWSHIAVVFNLNETKLYINGALDNTRLQTLSAVDQGYDITIGNQESGGPTIWNWKGMMDEMRYWNSARSQSEIQNSMNMELEGNEAGLEAYYDFNEGTPFGSNTDLSSVNDISSNGHDGSVLGFTRTGTTSNWVNSPVSILNAAYEICKTCTDTLNTAMDFDAINDYIEIPDAPEFDLSVNTSFSFESWVFPVQGIVSHTILSKGNGGSAATSFIFSLYQNKIALFIGDGSQATWIYSDTDVTFGQWMHAAVAYDEVTDLFTFYLNGKEDGQRTIPHGFFNGTSPVYIGRQGLSCNCNYFDGKMDDIRYWNTARTQAEIATNLYTELKGDEAGLVAYYDFNNGDPSVDNTDLTQVPDVTGNGHNGTVTNFNKFGGFSNWVKSPLRFSGDVDEDGLPDVCDSCIPPINLMLENTSLNGTYIARDKITLGNGITFPANANVLFRTPEIELFNSVNAPAGVQILVNPEPCVNQ